VTDGPRAALAERTASPAGSDIVLGLTWWVALLVLPFLAAAVALLYVLPTTTDRFFAWTIAPSMTAMLLGSAYAGGIWFFLQVLRVGRWHRVRHGFTAVLLFATLLALATFLHWDRFHFGHLSFLTWVVLYVSTPPLVAAALFLQRRADPGDPERADPVVPLAVRIVLAGIGLAALVTGAALFLAPQAFTGVWAWRLTPLTARVVGAVLTLPGMVNLWLLVDRRWSAFRWIFQAQLVSLVLMVGALVLSRAALLWDRPVTFGFVLGIPASLLVYLGCYLVLERRRVADRTA
jgi:hypothetical protein